MSSTPANQAQSKQEAEVRAAEAAARRESTELARAAAETVLGGYDPVIHTVVNQSANNAVSEVVRRQLGGVLHAGLERDLRDVRRSLNDALRR